MIHASTQGKDHLRKMFLERCETQEEFDVMIYNAVADFCFAHDYVNLGYYAVCGFYDNPASCDVKTADDVMPHVTDEEMLIGEKQEFYVLEAEHLKGIDKIKNWYEICLADSGYKVANYFSEY